MSIEQTFLDYSREKLNQYAARVVVCLDQLSDEEIWIRGTDNENAVGNLVLHLCGNVRQWIGFGVAGQPDDRVRDREFLTRGDAGRDELKQKLATVVAQAAAIIESLPPQRLAERTRVQGYDVTVLEVIYHVTEHFSHHTGQIIFAAKLLTGEDLHFYGHLHQASHSGQVP